MILTNFDFVKILNENAVSKLLIIHAVSKDNNNTDAVVIFEKSHFSLDDIRSYLKVDNPLEIYIDNDAYKKMAIYPGRPYNSKFKDGGYEIIYELFNCNC